MKPNISDIENFMTRPRALEDQVNDLTLPATQGKCVIMQSSLGNIAGAVGAALLIEVNDKSESGNEGDSEGRSTKREGTSDGRVFLFQVIVWCNNCSGAL